VAARRKQKHKKLVIAEGEGSAVGAIDDDDPQVVVEPSPSSIVKIEITDMACSPNFPPFISRDRGCFRPAGAAFPVL
jgi:hypothetical protein